jgi:sulfopropanediol 3-dehydrogenase
MRSKRVAREGAARSYAEKFDRYTGNIKVTREEIEAAAASLPQKLKDDIRFAHDNVRKFAEAQKKTLTDIEVEIVPGLVAGRRPSRSRPPAATCRAGATAMWPLRS